MLAKVHKKESSAPIVPFSLPRFGDLEVRNRHRNGTVDAFCRGEGGFVDDGSAAVSEIIRNAREEAARIIADAKEASADLRQAVEEKTDLEVKAMIETAVNERVAEIRGRLTETIEHISALADDITSQAETDLVQLAMQIAKKIVRREVTIDREIAFTLVKVSLNKLHNRSVATVHLNPEDLAFVEAHREACEFRGSLELVEDRSISVGGCLVHTETGDIDARIESQFDEIARGLFE